jgi:hypothetical protein
MQCETVVFALILLGHSRQTIDVKAPLRQISEGHFAAV